MSGAKRKKKQLQTSSRRNAVRKKTESPWKIIATVALTALAIMADLIGVFAGPRLLDLLIGAAALITGLAMILARRRLYWISAPRLSGIALATVGSLVIGVALHTYLADREAALRLAMQQTCAAAQDVREAWDTEYSTFGVSGQPVNTSAEQKLNTAVEDSLNNLTLAADRSDSQKARNLVHIVRVDLTTSLAVEPNYKQSFWLQVKGWLAFHALSKTCAASGYSIVDRGYAIQPSAREACHDFATINGFSEAAPSKAAKQLSSRQFLTKVSIILNRAFFNGINSQDPRIMADTYQFAAAFGAGISANSTPGSNFGWKMASAVRVLQQDCQSRGFWPPAN